VVLKFEEDKMDFSLWFPLEFLNQNDDTFSLRWIYSEGAICDLFSKGKHLL